MKSAILLLIILAGFGYGPMIVSSFTSLSWLEGTWASTRPNGSIRLETWKTQSDDLMTGAGMKVVGSDTTLLEELRLEQKGYDIFYIPIVKDQNQGQAIAFKLVEQEENQFDFANPSHDFPQKIVYTFRPIRKDILPKGTPGDTLDVMVASMSGEGFQLRFYRK